MSYEFKYTGWDSTCYPYNVRKCLFTRISCLWLFNGKWGSFPANLPLQLGSYSCNRRWWPTGLWDAEAPTFCLDNRLTDGGELLSLTCRPVAIFPPAKFLVVISVRGWVDPRAIELAGTMMSVEKSHNIIGNRTRDLPAYSIVPQRAMLPRAPPHFN
jgi:hypothetical protein